MTAEALKYPSNATHAAAYALSLFDGFELVEYGGSRITLPASAQRLLAFLAVHEGPHLRSYVAGMLWPDKSETRSHANLRSMVWRLRQPGIEVVDASEREIGLADGVVVDARQLVVLAQALFNGTDPTLTYAARDLLAARELLPGWYDEWVLVERERLRHLRQHALEVLCSRLVELGRIGEAVDVALSSVADDPLRESAQRVLIQAHLAEGNAAEALRQYETYRNLLRESLGVEPGPGVRELFDGIVDMSATKRRAPFGFDNVRTRTHNAGVASPRSSSNCSIDPATGVVSSVRTGARFI